MPKDLVSRIMAYEDGDLSQEDTILFFQDLIDSGLAWKLQGHYGRTARALIEAGDCHVPTPSSEELQTDRDLANTGLDDYAEMLDREETSDVPALPTVSGFQAGICSIGYSHGPGREKGSK